MNATRLRTLPAAATVAINAEAASRLLKAMANAARLQILCVLGDGELSVSALNTRIALSQSALSQHLAVLRADGLVATRREAQTIYYSVQPGPATEVIRALHDHFCTPPLAKRRRAPSRNNDPRRSA